MDAKTGSRNNSKKVKTHLAFSTISVKVFKGLRRCLWIFVGSFFLTPLLLWFFVTVVLGHDHSFQLKYFDFYRDLFSGWPELITPLLFLLLPVFIYSIAAICFYFYRHIRRS